MKIKITRKELVILHSVFVNYKYTFGLDSEKEIKLYRKIAKKYIKKIEKN